MNFLCKMKLLSLIACFVLFLASCKSSKVYQIGFYNVENLFDTIDNPNKIDEDFTSNGKYHWTQNRLENKILHLAQVIDSIGKNNILAFGFCEVENIEMLNKLIQTPQLNSQNLKSILIESADERGIDVGFVYNASVLNVLNYHVLTPKIPGGDKTRDILHVVTNFKTNTSDTLHYYICHWPSRREGTLISQPKRVAVAQMLKNNIDQVLNYNMNSKIIVLGDLNDEPTDTSIYHVLNAKQDLGATLINQTSFLTNENRGSIMYQKKYQVFDHIIISKAITGSGKGAKVIPNSAQVFDKDFLKQTDKGYEGSPYRTYGGLKYLGGYSDHFPVYISIKIK